MKPAQTARSTRATPALNPLNARPTAIAAATLCAAIALHAGQAHAQAAPAAATPASAVAPSSQSSQAITEVIVTAQKREQALIDVPASVTALNPTRLTEGGLDRLEDYVAEVPGMSIIALSRGYTSVVLRGISTGISQATPSTAFYIDEAPVGSITSYATGSTLTRRASLSVTSGMLSEARHSLPVPPSVTLLAPAEIEPLRVWLSGGMVT